MHNHSLRRAAVATWLVLVASGCADGGVVAEPGVARSRAVLGVDGKPLALVSTGTVIGDELLVRFAEGTSPGDIDASVAAAGGVITYQAPRTGYYVVRFAGITAAEQAAQTLRADPRVTDAAWQHVATASDTSGTGIGTSPSGPLAALQWNLHAMTMDPLKPREDAVGVVIAVLDTGVAYEDYADALGTYVKAPDLSEVDFVPGYDFINDDAHPNDDQRHGTHVTGIMVATSGIASIAPGATIMPIKVLDGGNSGTELALAEGLMFAADNGADVINMSLSFPPTYFPSRMLQGAIDYAAQRGCVMVAAAGNHGEEIVAYPAAFRDVIAVGASDLPTWYFTWGKKPWKHTINFLQRAAYSNHSYKLDVMAPGGRIDSDANGDGKPEAVLAQTFAAGNPSAFDYYFYAGTSQSSAQVSAVAAVMLAQNGDLDAFQVRAILAENAKRMGLSLLSSETGRGAVRIKKSVEDAGDDDATDYRQRYIADVVVTMHDVAAGVVATAHVEILEEDGSLADGVKVYGLFTGAAFQSVVGTTNSAGVVEFTSAVLEGQLVAFQVDAIVKGSGPHATFDRPRGFVRIDSQSLALLSTFGAGIGTSPSGIGTSPSDDESSGGEGGTGGSGIGTSPSVTLPTDPDETPISIAFDPALFAGTNYRPTLLLPNFSWGLATAPMAVAVDEAWFLATFPGAAERRVVSYGLGFGASGYYFDGLTSFPTPVVLDTEPVRIPLVLLTYTSGIGTSPSGIGTSPSGIGTSPSSIIVDRVYSGLDAALAAGYQTVLDGWYASAAGIGTSPSFTGTEPFPVGTFDHLSATANSYIPFADSTLSAMSSSYGTALGAAGMGTAPVDPSSDGVGVGIAILTP